MDNRLTAAEAALYYGQEIQYERFPLRGFSTGILDDEILSDMRHNRISKCKLKLRPISDITEDEAKHLGYANREDADLDYRGTSRIAIEDVPYMVKQGFDIFGWIQQGKALDITQHG